MELIQNKYLSNSIPFYQYNPKELAAEISQILSQQIELVEDLLPFFKIYVSDIFTVSFIFGIDRQIAFIVVHGSNEKNKTVFEQSEYRVFRTLSTYFSRALPYFMMGHHERGIFEFAKWLKSYETLFNTPCSKCGKYIEKDQGSEMLPPIIKSVKTNQFFHIKCSPQEIELPDFANDSAPQSHHFLE